MLLLPLGNEGVVLASNCQLAPLSCINEREGSFKSQIIMLSSTRANLRVHPVQRIPFAKAPNHSPFLLLKNVFLKHQTYSKKCHTYPQSTKPILKAPYLSLKHHSIPQAPYRSLKHQTYSYSTNATPKAPCPTLKHQSFP